MLRSKCMRCLSGMSGNRLGKATLNFSMNYLQNRLNNPLEIGLKVLKPRSIETQISKCSYYRRIYFSGLNKDIDEKDLTEWLKNHNKIKEILIKRSRFSLLRENDS